MFGFERLDAYQCSCEFLTLAAPLADKVPRGYAGLGDQLRRAAISVSLNIAEGTGTFDCEARRYYTIARGSALECAAVLNALKCLGGSEDPAIDKGRALLLRIVSMLTVMVRG